MSAYSLSFNGVKTEAKIVKSGVSVCARLAQSVTLTQFFGGEKLLVVIARIRTGIVG